MEKSLSELHSKQTGLETKFQVIEAKHATVDVQLQGLIDNKSTIRLLQDLVTELRTTVRNMQPK